MNAVRADMSHLPLNIVTVTGAMDAKDAKEVVAALAAPLAQKKRFYNIVDLSQAEMVNAECRALISQGIDARREEFAEYLIEASLIVTSGLMRGVLTAIEWLKSHPNTTRHVATLEEARKNARVALQKENIPLPPYLRL